MAETTAKFKPYTTPVLKYAGGKGWFVRQHGARVARFLATTGGTYVDPFMGGGAVPLALGPDVPKVLGDACGPVVDIYEACRTNPGELAGLLAGLVVLGLPDDGIDGGLTEADYCRVRDWEPEAPLKRAARMIYLNKLGFNGLMRFNRKGKFNVPYAKDRFRKSMVGRKDRTAIPSVFGNREQFFKVGEALADAQLGERDFRDTCAAREPREGDLWYFDSPYDGTFDGYTGRPFDAKDHADLATRALYAAARGAWVILHNEPTALIDELYPSSAWARIEAPEKRQINSDVKGRHRVPCWIITNRPELLAP